MTNELYLQRSDGSVIRLFDADLTTITLAEEENEKALDLQSIPKEFSFSFTCKHDPVEEFRFKTLMLGGVYWVGKVPRRIRRMSNWQKNKEKKR